MNTSAGLDFPWHRLYEAISELAGSCSSLLRQILSLILIVFLQLETVCEEDILHVTKVLIVLYWDVFVLMGHFDGTGWHKTRLGVVRGLSRLCWQREARVHRIHATRLSRCLRRLKLTYVITREILGAEASIKRVRVAYRHCSHHGVTGSIPGSWK